jgi:alpha-galactosidase
MKFATTILVSLSLGTPLLYSAQSVYNADQSTWTLNSGVIQAAIQLTTDGYLRVQSIYDFTSGDSWSASANQPSSPIHFQAGGEVFDASRQYQLLDQYTQSIGASGVRQFIVLQDSKGMGQITLRLEVYDGLPVLRYSVVYRNLTQAPVPVTLIDMVPWAFGDSGARYTAFRVNQWSVGSVAGNFQQSESALDPSGTPLQVYSGAHGLQCGWLALHDGGGRGLFAGWEFDGRAKTTLAQNGAQRLLQIYSSIKDLKHAVDPFADFEMPSAFIGTFHGDFDEAGYQTQRFVESVLAKPVPNGGAFPYVAWDSWGYSGQIDENTLRRNADVAASLGVELFIVDLGWARSIGDWYEDPDKFPHGLAALSDYVHSLGMKFGLHFALTEADPASPVLRQNPDWTSTESDGYNGAVSLCLSNQPARDWLIQQGVRMIDDYSVDWILQDGENMVKQCTKTTHTHDPADSNYANAVEGLNAVVSAIQAARPQVLWENCEDGGNMMTFNMVKSYVTSVTNDASGSLDSRQAVYGATYPFSPRYADRYMLGSDGLDTYATGSYRFGGNWVLMNQLASLTPDQQGTLGEQIVNYKRQRRIINGGKVYHILPPSLNGVDAIQSYNPDLDSALAVVTRSATDSPDYVFRPQGLDPDQRYTVWFDNSPFVYSVPGAQLMSGGVRVQLPTPYSADVVHIDHQ